MAIYEGGKLRLFLGDDTVLHETSSTINFNKEFTERATKDTDGTEVAPGTKSWSASGEGLAVLSLPAGTTDKKVFDDLFQAYDTDERIAVKFQLPGTGNRVYSGFAYIESLEITAPNDEDATASYQLRGDGAIVSAVQS